MASGNQDSLRILHPNSVPGDTVHDLRGVVPGDVLVLDNLNNSRYTGMATVSRVLDGHLVLSDGQQADRLTGRLTGSSHAVARLPRHGEVNDETLKALRGRLIYFDWELLSLKQLQAVNDLITRCLSWRHPQADKHLISVDSDQEQTKVRCSDIFKARGFGNPCKGE